MKRSLTLALALCLCACSTARVAAPAAIYGSVTPDEYAAAEEAFAGGTGPMPSIVEYWNDARCQELLDRRDGVLIAAATPKRIDVRAFG